MLTWLLIYIIGIIIVFLISTINNKALTTYGAWLAVIFIALTWLLFLLSVIADLYSMYYANVIKYIREKFPKEMRKKNEKSVFESQKQKQ